MTNPPSGGSVTEATTGSTDASGASGRPGAAGTPAGTTPSSGPGGSAGSPAAQPAPASPAPHSARAPQSSQYPSGSGSDFGATTLSGRTSTPDTASSPQPAPSGSDRPAAPIAGPTAGQAFGGASTVGGVGPSNPTPGPAGGPSTGPTAIRGVRAGRNRGPRRARLQVRHINPVTVLKFSCVLSIALFFVWLIVIGVLFGILDAAGVIGDINKTVTQLNGGGSKPPITGGIVFGGAAIIGVINIVLFIALTTIGAVIYNLCADLVGGIEITLSER